jgi:DNA-binding protein YbaB
LARLERNQARLERDQLQQERDQLQRERDQLQDQLADRGVVLDVQAVDGQAADVQAVLDGTTTLLSLELDSNAANNIDPDVGPFDSTISTLTSAPSPDRSAPSPDPSNNDTLPTEPCNSNRSTVGRGEGKEDQD